MLKQFKEFYGSINIQPNEIDDKTLICFDTNVLLNIYRYSDDTREKLFKAIKKVEDNIFIPYHSGLEFNLHKKQMLSDVLGQKDTIAKEIKEKSDKFINDICCNVLDRKILIKSKDEKDVRKDIKDVLIESHEVFMTNWIDTQLVKEFDLIKSLDFNNSLSEDLAMILDNKVGDSYNQEMIDKIEKEGEEKYKLNIPPGYKDASDRDKQTRVIYDNIEYTKKYGDLIIWRQIIDEVKKSNESDKKIDKVLFITDELKEDWIYKIGGKPVGIRAELRKEFLRETNAYINIKDTNGFLQLVLDIKEDLIQSIEEFNWLKKYRNNKNTIERHFSSDVDGYPDIDVENYFNTYVENIKPNNKELKDFIWKDEIFHLNQDKLSTYPVSNEHIIEFENEFMNIEDSYEHFKMELDYLYKTGDFNSNDILLLRVRTSGLSDDLIDLKKMMDVFESGNKSKRIQDMEKMYHLNNKVRLLSRKIDSLSNELAII